jgi:hypothetical protein
LVFVRIVARRVKVRKRIAFRNDWVSQRRYHVLRNDNLLSKPGHTTELAHTVREKRIMSTVTVAPQRQRSVRVLSTLIAGTMLFLAGCQAAVPGAELRPNNNSTVPAATAAHPGHVSLEIPEVTVQVSAAGINMPAELPAGPVEFHVSMSEDAPGTPMIARFVDGKGIADLGMALAAMATEGPAALFDVIALYGGGEGPAMEDFTLNLQAGPHVAVTMGEGEPQLQIFDVLLNEIEPDAPVADVEVEMLDFSFDLPAEIAAGEQIWKFSNEGGQWHETVVFHAKEGMSVDELIASASSEEPSADAPEMAFVWTPASVGETGWASIDLPAGDYIVICFLPNLDGDMSPHFAHGMVRTLQVK